MSRSNSPKRKRNSGKPQNHREMCIVGPKRRVRFSSMKAAKTHLNKIRGKGTTIDGSHLAGVYKCTDCGDWHITSRPGGTTR
jgi:hypothetical protein